MPPFSENARDLLKIALNLVDYDVDLKSVGERGVTIFVDPESLKEIVSRWPDFARFASEPEAGALGLVVPAHAAQGFVRTLARVVMH